jgi:hypothetical protein
MCVCIQIQLEEPSFLSNYFSSLAGTAAAGHILMLSGYSVIELAVVCIIYRPRICQNRDNQSIHNPSVKITYDTYSVDLAQRRLRIATMIQIRTHIGIFIEKSKWNAIRIDDCSNRKQDG